jgi:hypothetical protein
MKFQKFRTNEVLDIVIYYSQNLFFEFEKYMCIYISPGVVNI